MTFLELNWKIDPEIARNDSTFSEMQLNTEYIQITYSKFNICISLLRLFKFFPEMQFCFEINYFILNFQVVLVSATRPKFPEWSIKPRLEKKPEVQIVPVEAIVEFQCAAVGSPNPEIIWSKNGEVRKENFTQGFGSGVY